MHSVYVVSWQLSAGRVCLKLSFGELTFLHPAFILSFMFINKNTFSLFW